MPTAHAVAHEHEIPPGGRKIVDVAGKSIGVFNIQGRFYAIRNFCPHQHAPLAKGRISGTTHAGKVGEYPYGRQGEIIRCPWHGWEFDLTTGKSVFNPHKMKVPSYPVSVAAGAPAAEATPASDCAGACDHGNEDARLETFNVTVKEKVVLVHV